MTKSGALRWIRSSSRPAVQGDRVVGVYGAYIDITEQRLLEEQLRQAQKLEAIGTLAGGIAHDFNNMLSAILGYTALALGAIPQDSLPGHHLQQVLTAGERARVLVQQLLTFSYPTAQAPQPLQLHLLVKETLTLLRATVPRTIILQSSLDEQAGAVLADPTQMHQVLLNLGTNAAHAMRETGGVLEIGLEAWEVMAARAPYLASLTPGPYLRLTVRDTGHGMTPDILDRIFEPFFTTKDVGEGLVWASP